MIDSSEYIKSVTDYFGFLVTEFDFILLKENIRGNVFYDIQYKDNSRVISISYENLEDYLLVTVFILKNGEMPDYDDKTKTLHLKQLNRLVLLETTKEEIKLNSEYFKKFIAKNELERKLLKDAKELRLFLKHFKEIQ